MIRNDPNLSANGCSHQTKVTRDHKEARSSWTTIQDSVRSLRSGWVHNTKEPNDSQFLETILHDLVPKPIRSHNPIRRISTRADEDDPLSTLRPTLLASDKLGSSRGVERLDLGGGPIRPALWEQDISRALDVDQVLCALLVIRGHRVHGQNALVLRVEWDLEDLRVGVADTGANKLGETQDGPVCGVAVDFAFGDGEMGGSGVECSAIAENRRLVKLTVSGVSAGE